MEDRRRNIREINKDRILKNANTRERKKRLFVQRIKAAISLTVIIFLVIFVLLMTPLFNIRTIGVSGNEVVSISAIDSLVGDLVGKNLIRVSKADVTERLASIPYIKDIEISKKPIPATLYINITENIPAAFLNIEGKILVLDSEMTVIDDTNSIPVGNIPQILGVDSVRYSLKKRLKIDDMEKQNIVSTILSVAAQTDIINNITKIDVGNTLDTTMSYDNRLTIKCGTSLELDRKIRMFRETVTNASLSADANGVIDLSEPGKAIYTPASATLDTPLPESNTENPDQKTEQ